VNVLERYLSRDRLRLVDVGARGGIAARWNPFTNVLDVTAFEPEPDECERLNREAGSLPYPIRYVPAALGRESAQAVPLHITNWPVASGIYQPNADFLRSFPEAAKLFAVQSVEKVSLTMLDELAPREGITADCLKVDVEGAALDVLLGATSTLQDTLVLEVEAELNPFFEGEALFPEVDSHLRECGWMLLGLRRTSWRRGTRRDPAASGLGGQIVAVDALYWNDSLIRRGLSLRRELKLLVCLAAYLQMDAVLARLDGSPPPLSELSAAEAAELQDLLVPSQARLRRLAHRLFARYSSAQRRAFADRLQTGDATVWEDPHFF
jgi:FkbM family methyltransferase